MKRHPANKCLNDSRKYLKKTFLDRTMWNITTIVIKNITSIEDS